MDGEYYPCNKAGKQGIRAFQYEQAFENGNKLSCDRLKNRFYIHGKILPVCYRGEGWCASDRSDHGGTGLQGTLCGCPDIVKLRICKLQALWK